jgi:hypothetical protein
VCLNVGGQDCGFKGRDERGGVGSTTFKARVALSRIARLVAGACEREWPHLRVPVSTIDQATP